MTQLTEQLDLRGGQSAWTADAYPPPPSAPLPSDPVDIAIVGAGIMGAMLADRLTRDGNKVALIDRRPPGYGSTAASTALVMWAADVPLTHLARKIGQEAAFRRWRRVFQAVQRLENMIRSAKLECDYRPSPEVYLAGSLLDEAALRQEADLRRKARLPSAFLEASTVGERFGIAPRAALLSQGTFSVDPVKLTLELLSRAVQRGASITYSADVTAIEEEDETQILHLADGRHLRSRVALLATGYEGSRFLPEAFTIGSSYAIATPPGTADFWRDDVMIWEASDPYLYARPTADGRIIGGGEDEDFADANRRDVLIGPKSETLRQKLSDLMRQPIQIDKAWAATFGSSPDGLPAIGRVQGYRNLWLAAGFGGNGVSFAALAADLIEMALSGREDPHATDFDPYRFDHAERATGSGKKSEGSRLSRA
ncbi:NAD(P)/FAD-dependent oxidoreductase [Lacibacterium aquatile]|uniref:NAD(P)/FAD-dependent oxidoreductase n=1 Tax=Lacibacterium aquatile TaxID=1168082 RepID=A0ABW5DQY7_9PROT